VRAWFEFYTRAGQLTSIIEKRVSLHRDLANQQQQNDALKAQVLQLQSLANIGTAVYMIAHEINNLLTPLANYAALALENPDDKSLTDKALRKTLQNCRRAAKMMESMLAMVNGRRQEKENVPLAALVEDVFACHISSSPFSPPKGPRDEGRGTKDESWAAGSALLSVRK
jgi:signal transduction histidine kinase